MDHSQPMRHPNRIHRAFVMEPSSSSATLGLLSSIPLVRREESAVSKDRSVGGCREVTLTTCNMAATSDKELAKTMYIRRISRKGWRKLRFIRIDSEGHQTCRLPKAYPLTTIIDHQATRSTALMYNLAHPVMIHNLPKVAIGRPG